MTKDVSFSGKPPSSADQRVEKAFAAIGVPETKVPKPTKRVCVDLPQSLHTRVKLKCVQDDVSITQVIREFLEKKFPQLE